MWLNAAFKVAVGNVDTKCSGGVEEVLLLTKAVEC